ncbi:FG-GAP-like repeat-containing protein [Alcanivorax sp. P2S70]|uniref:FG-GAP-like repeat-containing protein n=1 Tax=Alcanivorax sp. P2S70 TaxID=1397527 RepID=UPI00068F4502|nr:FG-GAP-like repeat-containing protein [Alcanivorax sp. P2S70]
MRVYLFMDMTAKKDRPAEGRFLATVKAGGWVLFSLLVFMLSGCDSGDSNPSGESANATVAAASAKTDLDAWLRQMITDHGLTGDPATPRELKQTVPAADPKIKLGQLLFFSHTLSGDLTVSCATCHHPDFGGSDELSIGVGVAPNDAAKVGPSRILDPSKDLDPAADGKPNMHRNSQTVFNSAMFDRSMTFDGRIFVLDKDTVPGGLGQSIRTPESGNLSDGSAADGLMEVFSKFPLTNHNEMRAYLFSSLSQEAYREHLVARLRGEVDSDMLNDQGSRNWLRLFRDAFGDEHDDAQSLITLVNVQRAMAAYMKSMIFIDSPWKQYVDGDSAAISIAAKRGAKLFYGSKEQGGLGCSHCHSGDFFTNEKFYNTGFPQIGRGFMRAERDDIGRWNSTRKEEDKYAFRVPTLLNISQSMPYGHAGTFDTLEALLRYHSNPVSGLDAFDFSLKQLSQYAETGGYEYAESHTRTVQAASSFKMAESLLPGRDLGEQEVSDLKAFLLTLTDRCIMEADCRSQWVPVLEEDPDGNLLVVDVNPEPEASIPGQAGRAEGEPPTNPGDYPKTFALTYKAPGLTTFADIEGCTSQPSESAKNTGATVFHSAAVSSGLHSAEGEAKAKHGFDAQTWDLEDFLTIEPTMIAGGVSSTYLDGDCWLDLAYAGGDESGMVFYRNKGSQSGFEAKALLEDDPGGKFTGVAFADLNGDYRREMLFGNLKQKVLPIYSSGDSGTFYRAGALSLSRHTYGISFADTNHDGYPEIFLAHWSPGNVLTAPVFWKNNSGVELEHHDQASGLFDGSLSQVWNFSPQFADIDSDGQMDLLLASDFGTSVVMQGHPEGHFTNITDRNIISDENGMGAALGDYDNDGDLDWFVTSIFDPSGEAESSWGVTGNRLYRNTSSGEGISLEDVTDASGVADGNWGWAACFADFNNDGFLDIFHVNGFGNIPESAAQSEEGEKMRNRYLGIAKEYHKSHPRLFINQGNGTFREEAREWDLLPSDGRGITCLDYDRDGDMDIALVDHSRGLQFFSNQTGYGEGKRFLSVRLVGKAPNTEALGAKVQVRADLGESAGLQTQTRFSLANTNFNGQNPPDLHFGLADAAVADMTVDWPDGEKWVCEGVSPNQFFILDQRRIPAMCQPGTKQRIEARGRG